MTWAEKVKQRDGMKCVICGRTNRLQAHHIKPTFLYPECRSDVDNGISLCASCHQDQHGGNFAGYELLPVNGYDPDPEGRMEKYERERKQRQEERRMVHVVWGTNKENGELLFKAAKAAGQCPSNYIAEAVSMRLKAEGYEHDRYLFVNKWREQKDSEE